MLKSDAAAAAAAGGSGSLGGGAMAAARSAAASAWGPAAAAAAFGAVARDASAPLGGLGTPDDYQSPSPPHGGSFVIPPSPVVGIHSSQLPVCTASNPAARPPMPPISEAHPAVKAAAAAAAAVAPGTAAPAGRGLGLGGVGASALGWGLTLSSAVDDEVLIAALELLAPPAPAHIGGGSPTAAAAVGGSGGEAGPGGLVRSLSDVQLREREKTQGGARGKKTVCAFE